MTEKILPKTKKEMAVEIGVSIRTFQRWLKQANLDIKRGLICEEIQKMIREKIVKCLPDDSPQVVKTLIANGQADNYDKAGKLIVSNTVKSENLKSLIDCMTNIRIDPAQVESFIEKARSAGQLAFEKDKIVGIRNTMPTGGDVLMVYDLNRFVLLSFEVYRADKTIESRQIFFIQGDYKNPVLTGINQQHYFKSAASGVAMVATNYQQFDDFQFVNHLK